MATSSTVKGGDKVRRMMRRLQRQAPQALLRALFEEGLRIFEASQLEVPVDTGRLRGSGLLGVLRPARAIMGGAVVVAYGTAYALRIHENTGADKARGARGAAGRRGEKVRGAQIGKSKYLEDPFKRASVGMFPRVARRTKNLIAERRDVAEPQRQRGKKGKS